jgi:hypothetical protein
LIALKNKQQLVPIEEVHFFNSFDGGMIGRPSEISKQSQNQLVCDEHFLPFGNA